MVLNKILHDPISRLIFICNISFYMCFTLSSKMIHNSSYIKMKFEFVKKINLTSIWKRNKQAKSLRKCIMAFFQCKLECPAVRDFIIGILLFVINLISILLFLIITTGHLEVNNQYMELQLEIKWIHF